MSEFIEIEGNAAPPDAIPFTFQSSDDAPLRAGFFPVANPIAGVVLLTGWSEFIEKYFETVGDLNARGYSVLMMDWRGQGLSDRQSPYDQKWNGYFHSLKDDLRRFTVNEAKVRMPGLPLILMTHSMGGLPAFMLLADGFDEFERAVLCAPMAKLLPEPKLTIYEFAVNIACAIGFSRTPYASRDANAESFEGNIFTSDPKRHERFKTLRIKRPDAALGAPTFGWLREAMKTTRTIRAHDFFMNAKTPTLIIAAGNEKQVDPSAYPPIAANAAAISLATIPGALHEIMMERDEIRTEFWRVFDAFLKG